MKVLVCRVNRTKTAVWIKIYLFSSIFLPSNTNSPFQLSAILHVALSHLIVQYFVCLLRSMSMPTCALTEIKNDWISNRWKNKHTIYRKSWTNQSNNLSLTKDYTTTKIHYPPTQHLRPIDHRPTSSVGILSLHLSPLRTSSIVPNGRHPAQRTHTAWASISYRFTPCDD